MYFISSLDFLLRIKTHATHNILLNFILQKSLGLSLLQRKKGRRIKYQLGYLSKLVGSTCSKMLLTSLDGYTLLSCHISNKCTNYSIC